MFRFEDIVRLVLGYFQNYQGGGSGRSGDRDEKRLGGAQESSLLDNVQKSRRSS